MIDKDWNMIGTKEAAQILGVQQSTITAWISKNKCPFPYYKITPRVIRFKKTDVVAHMERIRNDGK